MRPVMNLAGHESPAAEHLRSSRTQRSHKVLYYVLAALHSARVWMREEAKRLTGDEREREISSGISGMSTQHHRTCRVIGPFASIRYQKIV